MKVLYAFILLAVLHFPIAGISAGFPSLPESFGSGSAMAMIGEHKIWTPDNMYVHVNGEAELLKRYGALSLAYASYENDSGAYLSVDILDMGAPVNAYGLYRLYAGCDGKEYSAAGATVLSGDFTSYAILGKYFMRIDFEAERDTDKDKSIVDEFLLELSGILPAAELLPVTVERLKEVAGKPCEVGYHPEHVDYDLEAGPGYTWTGPDDGTYYIRFLASADEAAVQAAILRDRGAPTVLVWGNVVTWPKEQTEETSDYLKEVLKRVVE